MSRTSRPSPPPRHEAERLYVAFSEVADALTPSPVPLAAIERSGRARRRRHTAGLIIGCCLLLAPLTSITLRGVLPDHLPPERSRVAGHPTPLDTAATAPARVLAPDERVQAGTGVELWLTEEGKHWSRSKTDHGFQSVDDRNLDPRHPTVGLNADAVGERYFLSGVYTGTDHAGRVVVSTGDGEVTASVVKLPGSPGWGAWYAEVPLHENLTLNRIALYDARGKEIAALTPSRP